MRKILVVAADHSLRTMIRLSLMRGLHGVVEAIVPREAVEQLLRLKNPSLAIVDVPSFSRVELDAVWDLRERSSTLKILVLTAAGDRSAAEQAVIAGANDVLCKPFSVDMLRRAVEASMARPSFARRLLGGSVSYLVHRARVAWPDRCRWDTASAVDPDGDAGVTFHSCTVNGFRISYRSGANLHSDTESLYTFAVLSPDGGAHPCAVLMPSYLPALVKALTDREQMPGGERFWESMAEAALVSHIEGEGGIPESGVLYVEELSHDLRSFVRSVLAERIPSTSPVARRRPPSLLI